MGLFDFLKKKYKVEASSAETLKDADGNVYQTLKIGSQIWSAENLNTTKYNNGTNIPLVTDSSKWAACADNKKPACCWYDNKNSNKDKFGILYNWYVVHNSKLAPKGWHVSTDAEWMKLEEYLVANGYNCDELKEGNKIAKSLAAQTDWQVSKDAWSIGCNLTMNNSTGFSALPGGYRNEFGSYDCLSFLGYWWTNTEYVYDVKHYPYHAWIKYMRNDLHKIEPCFYNKGCGFSVRLVRD
jgi:uncharacterized protein (TIGR02145 family)